MLIPGVLGMATGTFLVTLTIGLLNKIVI
jgi:hypothetical protein